MLTNPPDIAGALETTRRAIRDGNRAAQVISRLRAMFGNKEFDTAAMDLNETAREVIALSAHELQRHRIAVHTEFSEKSLQVIGDRVQISKSS